jgi:cytochrome P450
VDKLPQLTFTTIVIQEAMRLYPPIWAMERRGH